MSLFWNDSSTTGSPKKVVEQKCLTKSVPSKDLTKEQIDQAKEEKSVCERVEPSSDQVILTILTRPNKIPHNIG